MERRELEERLRASLQARADDVEPTPALWARVEDKAMRKNRWRVGVMALGAAAAIVVAVVAVPMLFDGPFRVDDVPPPMGTPTEPQVTEPGPGPTQTSTDPGPGGDDSLKPFLVVTDGATLFLDAGADGGAMTELQGYGGTGEPWAVSGIAVQPGSTVDDLTVATSFMVEGNREIAVDRFVDGESVETYRLETAAQAGQAVPDPTLAWSDDGRFLAWTSFADNTSETEPMLRVLTWARGLQMAAEGENPADAAGNIPMESSTVTVTELRLQDWTGATATLDDQSTLWFTTLGAQAASMTVTMDATGGCLLEDGTTINFEQPECGQVLPVSDVEEAPFEAGAIADIGHEQNGLRYVLAVRSSADQDAEGATMSLQLEPDSDIQQMIELPEEMVPGGAAPGERWLEVVPGGPLVVGVGTQAWILQIPDGAIENTPRGEPISPEIIPLPGITAVAGAHPGVTTTP